MPSTENPVENRKLKQNVRIHIGDYYASATPAVIHTALGSCVAVCLFDPIFRVGGMNHILLPGFTKLSVTDGSARYGVNAMELLINRIIRSGGKKRNLQAKVFGGADVLNVFRKEHSVGMKNTTFALEYLYKEEIEIVGQSTGGKATRIVKFHTDTGEALVKTLRAIQIPRLLIGEKKAARRMQKEVQKSGEIELFPFD